ncbi:HAMP domain-containing sensor histidine kinase [[Clostridium] fimetarium]|uniref:histidine kinase n=1 Tax=[Clostridium] fimetarium TaxID=99656 RepID=A0A1I0R5K0_9FIRM|nr:HAMP domain-containing sensor histidine kinase [[Clostridium] fimetarium]SEW35803.1 Signal transduction histidine kinase [[Clostridium] fimetarium]
MGKLTIKLKICVLLVAILIGVASLCVSIVVVNERNTDRDMFNRTKVLLNNGIYMANGLDFSELDQYTYSVVNLSGKVLYSNDLKSPVGEQMELKMLSGMSKGDIASDDMIYSTPFIRNDVQVGTIYVSVPYSLVSDKHVSVYVIMAFIIIYIISTIFLLIRLMFKDILEPISMIHKVTNSIRDGHFQDRLYYDYDGEIGTLCHDFEGLRSDLEYSTENEKKLKEKEKLLMAYISHDLRTPIATISGYVEGIHNDIVKGDRVHEYTSIILKKIGMLNSLIDDILEHSQAQLHEFEIKKCECYSRKYFDEIMIEAKQDVDKKGLTFSYSQIPDVLINIDEKRIRQVMQNLLGNAMKFTNEGQISVNYKVENDYLLIAVRDTGIGIAAIDIPMVFGEFYRGEKARTLNVQGSGLGLSISKYIVEQHGGRIECDSILDQWTEIQFSISI